MDAHGSWSPSSWELAVNAMSNATPPGELDDAPDTATVYLGDAAWHNGPGWYYVIDEYPDEGSCGAFATREEAIEHASSAGLHATGPSHNPKEP